MGVIGNFSTCMFRAHQIKSLPESLYKHRLSEIALAFYLERFGALGFVRGEYTVYRQHAGGVWSGAGKFGQFLQRVRCREQVRDICREEYVPLVDADIQKTEDEFQRYFSKVVSMCRTFEKRAADAERRNAELKKALEASFAESARQRQRAEKCGRQEVQAAAKARRTASSNSKLQKEIVALKSSEAYRVGMFVTWPVRKAWGGVKCLRENGVKYTAKHAVGKVLRVFGSNCKW